MTSHDLMIQRTVCLYLPVQTDNQLLIIMINNLTIKVKFLLIAILLIGQVKCKPLGTPNDNFKKTDDDWIPEVIIAKQWIMNPYYRSKPVGYFWVPQPELEPKHDYEEADDLIAEGNEEIAAINKLKTAPSSSVTTKSTTEFTTESVTNDNSQTTTPIDEVTSAKTSSMTIESIAKVAAATVLIILLLVFLYYFNFHM